MLAINDAIDKYNNAAFAKSKLGFWKMIILAILAGAFIALAGFGSITASVYTNKVVGAAIFPIGLIMVVLCGTELFTGNCLMIGPACFKKIKIIEMLKNWLLVFIGNFIGAVGVTFLISLTGLLNAQALSDAVVSTANAKVSCGFLALFIKGIFCNLLVCVAVWLAFISKTTASKILCIIPPIFLFVLVGFEHSIANMFYIPAEIFLHGGLSWADFLLGNLAPVTLGNIVGGCTFGIAIWVSKKLK